MGLLDMQQPQQAQQPQQPQGGLLAGAPGQANLPPEMIRVIEQIKQAPPEQQRAMVEQIIEKIKAMPKSPQEIEQAIQQFIQAVQS